MEQKKLKIFASKFKKTFSEKTINQIGKATRYCRRERQLTPFRMLLTLVTLFSGTKVESLADIQRGFNALFGYKMDYKPFYNRLATREFAVFMRACAMRLLEKLVVQVLCMGGRGPFSEFKRIIIQDGSSFAIKDCLKEVFPGRFKTVSPAAVELHATLDLLKEEVTKISLTQDTASERGELPTPESLKGALFLADRGYFDLSYLADLMLADVHFVFRSLFTINPKVDEILSANGRHLLPLVGRKLKDLPNLPKKQPLDLLVHWILDDGRKCQCRLLVTWNPKTREYQYLITNLSAERYSPEDISNAYRLRWQIELMFKEWKSYANLHAFDTRNQYIVEGLIWASICAATLKRFLAHTTQIVAQVDTSTRKVAMCAVHVLADIVKAFASGGDKRLLNAFRNAVDYLAVNAKRAHPKRDRKSGRLKLGFEPVFDVA